MHVVSEEGDYSFKKVLNLEEPSPTVCGLYVVTDPNKVVEISMKFLDVSCDSGALMAVYWTFIERLSYSLMLISNVNFSSLMDGNWMKSISQMKWTIICR